MRPRVGVLALQGDFAAHAGSLERAGAAASEVRTARELEGCAGLVIPGGESTTLLKLMEGSELPEAIVAFHLRGGALFGTCAGAILLAREVRPAQRSLGLIDLVVERNAYGRQRESFEGRARPLPPLAGEPLPMLFIRAPRIVEVGRRVQVLATMDGDVILASQDRVLVTTGHPELAGDLRVHRLFLDRVLHPARSEGLPASRVKNQPLGMRPGATGQALERTVP
jgi:5'-phosphate synthase pdxT subunit